MLLSDIQRFPRSDSLCKAFFLVDFCFVSKINIHLWPECWDKIHCAQNLHEKSTFFNNPHILLCHKRCRFWSNRLETNSFSICKLIFWDRPNLREAQIYWDEKNLLFLGFRYFSNLKASWKLDQMLTPFQSLTLLFYFQGLAPSSPTSFQKFSLLGWSTNVVLKGFFLRFFWKTNKWKI